MFLHDKDSIESKYQYVIKNHEEVGLKNFKDPKGFYYSSDMKDVYKSIEDFNPGKEGKVLIAFEDMITDMIINKKLHLVVTE